MVCAGTMAGAVAGLVLAGYGDATAPVLIGTDAPFPAYTYLDADGVITGFERDVMDEVCVRAVLDCRWKMAVFGELVPGVMAGRFDIVLGGIAVTDERRLQVDFTQSYHSTDPEEWYIGHANAPMPSLALTAVQSGTVHEAHLQRLGYRHVGFATEAEVLAALAGGTTDLALGPFQSRADIQSFMVENGLDYLYSDLIPDDGVAMAVCKGNPLLDSLDAALDAMRADGTLAALEFRWFE
ncbi:MAG: transporter substrate-binding domain-containing protein [Rhodobacterales bacterium]|nr:transporter substrate-binding domain-containing protein [Rhodobacterales bacterium]